MIHDSFPIGNSVTFQGQSLKLRGKCVSKWERKLIFPTAFGWDMFPGGSVKLSRKTWAPKSPKSGISKQWSNVKHCERVALISLSGHRCKTVTIHRRLDLWHFRLLDFAFFFKQKNQRRSDMAAIRAEGVVANGGTWKCGVKGWDLQYDLKLVTDGCASIYKYIHIFCHILYSVCI